MTPDDPELSPDPLGTASLREAALAGWSASVHRFREDANAEEALVVGGYADRVLIELLANAVDAARDAGVPARVLLSWSEPAAGSAALLSVANTGAPLTAAGVAGLATLRASAKRHHGHAVGHFGVGFTAVLAVTDSPQVLSAGGGVVFDRERTVAAIAALDRPELLAEVAARGGLVPTLRLPWPAVPDADAIAPGYSTVVRLPLTDRTEGPARAAVDGVDSGLFWALPGLDEIQVHTPGRNRLLRRVQLPDGRVQISDDGLRRRYLVTTRSGTVAPALLAGRPVEERSRERWWLSWIHPDDGGIGEADEPTTLDLYDALGTAPPDPAVLGAPTPTDEPLSLPARLVGTFPVDDTRRRLATGPLADFLLAQAVSGYLELVLATPVAGRPALVPVGGFPLGPIDGLLRREITSRLAAAPILRTALGIAIPPVEACRLDGASGAAAELLGEAIPGLLGPSGSVAADRALRNLGVTDLAWPAAIGALAGLSRPPRFWKLVYQAVSDRPAEELVDLPVPLAGGRMRIGVRGTLLADAGALDPELVRRACEVAPELAIVHPEAADRVLLRAGAEPVDAGALLRSPALIEPFADLRDDVEDDAAPVELVIARAELALDLAAGGGRGGLLADLVLTDVEGEPWPAAELLVPDAPLAAVLAADASFATIGSRWTEQYPRDLLIAVGVRSGLPVVLVAADPADPADPAGTYAADPAGVGGFDLADLPDAQDWLDETSAGDPIDEPFTAVADLDLIADDAWPRVLTMIAADRAARDAVLRVPSPSYTAWWLRRFALVDGHPLRLWRIQAATDLVGLFDTLPFDLEADLAAAVGVLDGLPAALHTDPDEVLRRWTDPARSVPARSVVQLTGLLADLLAREPDRPLPALVRVLSGAAVPAEEAVVLDRPWLAAVVDPDRVVPGGPDPAAVAAAFDLALASEAVPAVLEPSAQARLDADLAERAAAALGALVPAGSLSCRPALAVRIGAGAPVRVPWWPAERGAAPGRFLVDGSPAGIGRAVAYLAGRWPDRQLAEAAVLGGPMLSEFGC